MASFGNARFVRGLTCALVLGAASSGCASVADAPVAAVHASTPHLDATLGSAAAAAAAATPPMAQVVPVVPHADANADDEAIAPAEQWPFLEQAIGSCVRDGLARTDYLVAWYAHARMRHDGPPEGPRPLVGVLLPVRGPTPDSEKYASARQALLTAWDQPERHSHIMDCTVRVAAARAGHGASRIPYTIYLPADYLRHPLRKRAVLLLASGGRGSRSRWFLPPLSTLGVKPATGGLEMQARMDAWAAAHPDTPTPLVVAIDGTSEAFVNGMAAFIDHELPDHLLAAYLPHQTREQTPYGVESVSSGAAVTLRALRANPRLFSAVGLTSLYCAGASFDPRRDLGRPRERKALLAELASRHEQGLFDLRLSMGALDQYWECNYELFRDLRTAGVLPVDAGPPEDKCAPGPWKPVSRDPPSSPAVRHCSGQWSAFESWPGTAHHYRALLAALPSALEWNLDRLQSALERSGETSDTSDTSDTSEASNSKEAPREP